MKCSVVLKRCLQAEHGNLEQDVQDHLKSCPVCNKIHQRCVVVRNLLILKRYEHPSSGFEERSLLRIQQRIEWQDSGRESPDESGWTWLPRPAYAFSLASLILLFAGAMFYTQSRSTSTPSSDLPLADSPEPVLETPTFRESTPPVILAATNRSPVNSIRRSTVVQVVSNRSSGLGKILYGGDVGASVPVKFER